MSNNNQRIFSVLEKIFYKRSDEKDEIYTWDDIFQALSEYISWVDKIKQDFEIKREYDIEHIAEQLFSLGDFNKQICKYHISMLYISLKKIEYELRDSEKKFNVTNDFIKGELALLKDLVWDGSELIGACEKSILKREPTVTRGRRRLFSSNEIFYSSIDLLRRHVNYNDITVSSLPIFQIRQAIETKALNSLGIGEILGVDRNPAKFKLERLIEFIDRNKKISYPVKKSLVLKITKWTNFYIHRGVMNYHWMIILAHEILKPIFQSGKGKSAWSLYGAIKIDKTYFEESLEKDLLKFLDLSDAEIIPLSHPEALIEPLD